MELAEDGDEFGGTAKARQDFPQSISADGIKGLGQVYESCIWTYVLFSAFLLYQPQYMSTVPLLDLIHPGFLACFPVLSSG